MRKYTITIACFALLLILASTNPERLSAQGLMLTLIFIALVSVYVIRSVWFAARRRFGFMSAKESQEEQVFDLRSLSLGIVAVIFLFFLNLAGSLSVRDFLLAIVLSFLCHFYLERRLNKAE